MSACSLKVAVIGGGGMMGKLIGADLALHGHMVTLNDRSEDALRDAKAAIHQTLLDLCEKGMITAADVDTTMERIKTETNLREAVKDVDFVSEAIVENLRVKKEVFKEISEHCPERAILSTNSMTLSIGEISEEVIKPERVVGVRFLFPVLLIADVELTSGLLTSVATLEQVKSMLLSMDKTPFFKAPGAGNYLRLEPSTLEVRQREGAEKRRARIAGVQGAQPMFEPEAYYGYPGMTASMRTLALSGPQGGITPSAPPLAEAEPPRDESCSICLDAKKNALFVPCGHLSACFPCAQLILSSAQRCPVCRARIEKVVKVFIA